MPAFAYISNKIEYMRYDCFLQLVSSIFQTICYPIFLQPILTTFWQNSKIARRPFSKKALFILLGNNKSFRFL